MARRAQGTSRERPRTAIVLSGGGARGAYQAGVLQGLVDIGVLPSGGSGCDIIVGSSAGSINAGMLAAYADDNRAGVARLIEVWSTLEADHVFRTDIGSLGRIGARWAWDLSFGGALRRVQPKSLLDTAPLRELLKRIPFARIEQNVKARALYALAVSATDLYTSTGYLFVHGQAGIRPWKRSRWRIELTRIRLEHLMASSAIPVFFPTVQIDGRHFGDGSLRNTAPLSPAINLGADRIVTIGVLGAGPETRRAKPKRLPPPTIAQIAGVLLDAVMLDAVEADVEHAGRVNTSVLSVPDADSGTFRWIDVLWLSPSADIGAIASRLARRVPPVVRYLMRGLGTDEAITELLSYLLFDPAFCGELIALGRADVLGARPHIEAFFTGGGPPRRIGHRTGVGC